MYYSTKIAQRIADGAKMLRHLSLVKCTAVSSVTILSNFRALEYLNFDQCHFVTNEGLGSLAVSCTKLSHLNLALARITDDGLLHLVSCTILRTLEIPYCRGVQGPDLVTIALSCNWIQYLVHNSVRGVEKTVLQCTTGNGSLECLCSLVSIAITKVRRT